MEHTNILSHHSFTGYNFRSCTPKNYRAVKNSIRPNPVNVSAANEGAGEGVDSLCWSILRKSIDKKNKGEKIGRHERRKKKMKKFSIKKTRKARPKRAPAPRLINWNSELFFIQRKKTKLEFFALTLNNSEYTLLNQLYTKLPSFLISPTPFPHICWTLFSSFFFFFLLFFIFWSSPSALRRIFRQIRKAPLHWSFSMLLMVLCIGKMLREKEWGCCEGIRKFEYFCVVMQKKKIRI